jgi:hypothetical protein
MTVASEEPTQSENLIRYLRSKLVVERTAYLLLHDDHCPDIGMGLSSTSARRDALEQLGYTEAMIEWK